MTDREKAIEGLEYLVTAYAFHGEDAQCIGDAIELLKEQEPVKTEPVRYKVVRAGGSSYPFWDCVCDGCGFKTSTAHTNWRFCPGCGKAVKWDE